MTGRKRILLIFILFISSISLYSQKFSDGYAESKVEVTGAVLYPGLYILDNQGIRISDILQMAGLAEDADSSFVVLKRLLSEERFEKALVAVDIAKKQMDRDSVSIEYPRRDDRYNIRIDADDILNDYDSPENMLLENGDMIFIPKFNNTVSVSGAVNYPSVVIYNGDLSLNQYIDIAGGYDDRADRKNISIFYVNGIGIKRGDCDFEIRPGCEIAVPYLKSGALNRVSREEVVEIASTTGSATKMVIEIINLLIE